MGLGSSKSQSGLPPGATPAISPEAVDALCREAYTAGASDADIYNTSQREAMQRQDAMMGGAACLLSAWLAYVYGRARGTGAAEEAAAYRYNAQQTLLEKVNTDLVAVAEENKTLLTIRQDQEVVIAQQRRELQTAARERQAMQQAVHALKRRNASVRRQLRGLTASLHTIQRQMYVGMAGAGVLLLAVVWSTRPLRRRPRVAPEPEPESIVVVDVEAVRPSPDAAETEKKEST